MRRRLVSLVSLSALIAVLLVPGPNPAVYAAGRDPVIVVPGVGGSELTAAAAFRLTVEDGRAGTYARDYRAGEKVWVNTWEAAKPGEDDYFDVLKLKTDGVTPVAPALQVSGIYDPAYGDLIGYLQRQGYVLGHDLWLFPYDWRKDIRTTAGQLDATITRALIAANGGRSDPASWTSRRVDIVGHSMGGLVGRYYVSDPRRASRVDQLITLGSPQLGAASFLKALLYGDQFGPAFLGIGLNPNAVKDVVQNMPGGMQLLPSRAYYDLYDNSDRNRLRPFVEDRDVDGNGRIAGVLSYAGAKELLLNMRKNANAIYMAESWHDEIDRRRHGKVNDVRWAALVGYGTPTFGQVREYTGACLTWSGYKPCPKREELPVDGDGTVPTMSAAMGDPERRMMLDTGAHLWFMQRQHGDLVKRDYMLGVATGDGPALQWIGGVLSGAIAMTADGASLETSAPDPVAANGTTLRVDRLPRQKLRGMWIAALGPVVLHVQDAQGRSAGRVQAAADIASAGMPEARYEQLPGSEFIFVKRATSYTLTLHAAEAGSTDLKVRVLDDGGVERTAVYLGIRLGAQGRAQLTIGESTSHAALPQGWPALQLDADGDGVFEAAVLASSVLDQVESADVTPPTLSIDGSLDGRDLEHTTQLRWRSADDVAGVLFEHAMVDPDTPAAREVRNGDMVALEQGQHRLVMLAVDRAGNAASQEVSFVVR